jgi:hypothetical protein
MKRLLLNFVVLTMVSTSLFSIDGFSQRRRGAVVVRRPRLVRATLVIGPGHPIHRVLPREVVIRPARRVVVRERLVWQDSETIARDEEWVDTNFGIDEPGNALFLDIHGRTKLNFAEVTFGNGNVQVIDFNERTHGNGVYNLLDFADGRQVATVRILAKSESEETKLSVYLSK